ncbi:MAG: DUF4442 domain-containing protein [Lewinellaceae bacterium]|nr:DUF4442 domain-containing protein [Saprospiraceae bacterium]MCB9315898.1 DUF4442 domain-containing protein [Lewinellaceae bacterium]MCB9330573.1 DUF4442 domain-containing protein [Lewinellaceae bacterium]
MRKDSFLQLINTPWKMRLYLWGKLPAAAFMGIRVLQCSEEQATVQLPYGWRSQNPFRSIYFAAQCAAGELSTGLLGLAALQGKPPVSMLVLNVEAAFLKKAATTLRFICLDGAKVESVVQNALKGDVAQTIRMESIGYLPDGTEAARVWITWSFKKKQ